MNNLYKYYPELAKLYKEYKCKADALYDEFQAKVDDIISETDDKIYVSNMFNHSDYIQVYPDKPSDGAIYSFSNDSSEYYVAMYDGVEISECVRKEGVAE